MRPAGPGAAQLHDPTAVSWPAGMASCRATMPQIAVDAAHQVIVAQRLVTMAADYTALVPWSMQRTGRSDASRARSPPTAASPSSPICQRWPTAGSPPTCPPGAAAMARACRARAQADELSADDCHGHDAAPRRVSQPLPIANRSSSRCSATSSRPEGSASSCSAD